MGSYDETKYCRLDGGCYICDRLMCDRMDKDARKEKNKELKGTEKPVQRVIQEPGDVSRWLMVPGKPWCRKCADCGMISYAPCGYFCKWCGKRMKSDEKLSMQGL